MTLWALLIFWLKILKLPLPPPEEWVGKELAILCGKISEQHLSSAFSGENVNNHLMEKILKNIEKL